MFRKNNHRAESVV
ncbi:Protein of unknown function [Thermobacillus xylanilyticus]|uniref:Uncharacterized protein n=1 Tax=Thermobacillus xylanilyticus TaxID=76633 RepID=A0ABM8V7D9_THEXY|nr:Protein of unknown function [Thermobacillus xylanilyticus]